MTISLISVTLLPDKNDAGMVTGVVSLRASQRRIITLYCTTDLTHPDRTRTALIADALRQLAYMPEYRRDRRA